MGLGDAGERDERSGRRGNKKEMKKRWGEEEKKGGRRKEKKQEWEMGKKKETKKKRRREKEEGRKEEEKRSLLNPDGKLDGSGLIVCGGGLPFPQVDRVREGYRFREREKVPAGIHS